MGIVARTKTRNTRLVPATPKSASLQTVPTIPRRLATLFRLSRPRTWVFTTTSFLLGYTVKGWSPGTSLAAGIAVACLITAATNIINAYADRHEDSINQPARVFWINQVGQRGAVVSSILLYAAASYIALFLGPLFLLILSLGIFSSSSYSLPPLRLKARPLPGLIAFSGAVGLPFLSGLAAHGALDLYNPLLWLTTYFMFTYGTVKNLPDYLGDRKTGTRTTATMFRTVREAVLFSGALLYTPFIVLVALVAARMLPPVYLLDIGFATLLTLIFRQMWRARDPQHLERAHTLAFFYAISFLLFTLVLTIPSIESVIVVTVSLLWTILVSKINIDSRVERGGWNPLQHLPIPSQKDSHGE